MPALVTFGRILFAVLFIYLGVSKLYGFQSAGEEIAAKVGIPAVIEPYISQLATTTGLSTPQLLAVVIGGIETIGGLMIALNFGARLFSILLILFVGAETFYFYDVWNHPGDGKMLVDALKNLSIIGALFMIGGYSRRARTVETTYGDV